ncbi:hypothetical protein SAMN05421504_1218 [Amycolatopsis xylanica]|uniref:Uncharacterized protein n=1 Tax=Amycolatopsis xylanica TaxID=589385 RepID=A0A1H3T9G9_9PSEU|nr:hypothetical protein SAMN05421504_1218 [Amycolatopsis xylanica]
MTLPDLCSLVRFGRGLSVVSASFTTLKVANVALTTLGVPGTDKERGVSGLRGLR